MKKIVISGGNGKLANRISDVNVEHTVLQPSKLELDVTCRKSIEKYLDVHRPDIFIHAGAYTRPMSKHFTNPDTSILVNIIGTGNVTIECMRRNIKLIYISTDYVYPGIDGNYSENDPLSPYSIKRDGISNYGWSKLGGECSVMLYENSLILRLCMCNKPFPHKTALVDVKKSYIYEDEAAKIILRLLDEKGVINVGGESQSVYEFAKKDNEDIIAISANDIHDVTIAPDTTMNIDKLTRILRGEDEH